MKDLRHKARRTAACIMILALALSILRNSAWAADPTVLQPPQRNRVSDIGYVQNLNLRDWYATLNWDAMTFPPEADERYLTLGFNEVGYGTGKMNPDVFQVSLPGGATGFDINSYTPEGIKNGTIYETYVKATYKTNTPTGQYTVGSQKSNPAKFLTGLHVSVELIPGTNNIKIKWDDVWDTTGRINYRILISDTKGFTQPPPIPDIVASDIGKSGSAVTVNQSEKKLEYIYTYALPGREYSIKVVPLPSASVACATVDEIDAVTIKTDILLKARKVGYTNEGDVIWKLFWNPIVKGNTFTRVDYELYRYTGSDPQGQLFRLIPDIDSYQITVKKNDPTLYSFRIDAKAYVQGNSSPIEFRSNNKVALKEQVPQQPQAPDIVDTIANADPTPLVYDNLLSSTGAAILWRVPYTGDGQIDTDVTYDIYLVEDIKNVANPPSNFRIASDLGMSEANQVKDRTTGKVIGYRYNLTGLKSNSTYYFIIYAKKNFLVQSPQDGFMISMPYISKQAVKVIITRPDTGTDRPVAPPSPPFGLKPGPDNVSFTGATLVLNKKWHALYNEAGSRWEYVTADDYTANQQLDSNDPAKRDGMIVNYPAGWRVVPHAVGFNDALNAIKTRNNRTGEYVAYSDLSQADIKAFEIAQQPASIPNIADDADQQFSFGLTGLTHNTSYIVWVTIENQNGTASDPSDPIIITTPPQIPDTPVTPTVPTDLKGIAADSFVDLFWTFTKDMEYEIKGGKSDALTAASITAEVTYEEIQKNTFKRIDNLDPDTIYYFWIKAVSHGTSGQAIESEYSNPLIIKTEAYKPPAPPAGFGVKSGADGVTEKSISYVWESKAGFTYYLEFSDNANFDKATMTQVSGNAHTVTNLISNRRYYARLYAYENKTKLRSEPTRAIMVITNKSKNEYDASYDLDQAVSGDGLVVPARLENGIWTASSTGANAHVLAERVRAVYGPIVQIDLSEPPASTGIIRLDIGAPVLDVLSELKKELYVKLPWGQYLIRPGAFQTDEYYRQKARNKDLSLRLEAVSPAAQYKPSSTMQIRTPVSDIKASYLQGNTPVVKLTRPIRVELPVASLKQFMQGQVKVYSYDGAKTWYALPTFSDYANNRVVGELDKPGPVVGATTGVQPASGVPAYIAGSMKNIQSVFNLKSINGKAFNHAASISQKDMLKLVLDVVPSAYTDSDMNQKAVRAGLIRKTTDITAAASRRDKAVELLMSLYKFKTREKVAPSKPGVWSRYKDLNKVDKNYLNAYKFALENGIVLGNGSYSYPEKHITYGDFLVMLERTLRLCGEL